MIPETRRNVISLAILLLGIFLISGCAGSVMKLYNTADEQFAKAREAYAKDQYARSINGFQKVLYNFSGAPMVDSAQYYLAMAHFHTKDYFIAATEFERLVRNYPGSPFVDDSQFMTGVCYFKAAPDHYGLDQSELEKGIEALRDFITDNPGSDLVTEARMYLDQAMNRLARKRFEGGRTYLRLGYLEPARIYFQSVIDEHTTTEWAARSLFYLGEINFKEGQYDDAKTKFENFLIVYPDHDYAGRAQQMLDETDEHLAKGGDDN